MNNFDCSSRTPSSAGNGRSAAVAALPPLLKVQKKTNGHTLTSEVPRKIGVSQGLVNVPFWGYWTSPYSSHYRPYT